MKYSVKVNEVRAKEGSNIKGFATVVFGDSFKITNIAILENKDKGELFVSMPRYRSNERDESNVDCQHFFRQIFLGYFSDIVQAFDTLRKNVCGDDYTSLHNPIVLSSVLPAYGMFHSIQILFL